MNDRFKFRVWDKEINKFRYGDVALDCSGKPFVITCNPEKPIEYLDNVEVNFCTGCKDRNGKDIYMGDIVKIPDDWDKYGMFAGETREVYFYEGGFRLKPKWDKKARGNWLEDTQDFIILGNVYTTPELLEGGKNDKRKI